MGLVVFDKQFFFMNLYQVCSNYAPMGHLLHRLKQGKLEKILFGTTGPFVNIINWNFACKQRNNGYDAYQTVKHSPILLNCTTLPLVFKAFVLSIFGYRIHCMFFHQTKPIEQSGEQAFQGPFVPYYIHIRHSSFDNSFKVFSIYV